tara:strand:- start:615 stop:1976 length:1362 start_codon:yes stop_codon:yes gene_type:complete
MPPMEFLVKDFWITIPTIKNSRKLKINNIEDKELLSEAKKLGEQWQSENILQYTAEQLLLDVYTDSSLYSTLNNSYNFLFFSRAFELIFYSLKQEENLKFLLTNVYQILRRKPFYSVISMADTKIAFDGEEDELSFSEDSTVISSSLVLSAEIRAWRKKHNDAFKEFDAIKLIPIFSYCFNSVLTAMNVIKGNYSRAKNKKDTSEAFKDEHLTDMVIRFKYNLLNSILRAGIFGEAIYANVLIGAKSSTVRNADKLKSYERTYQRNLNLLEEEQSSFENNPKETARLQQVMRLHDLISEHPVFSMVTDESNQPLLKIGSKDRSQNSSETEKENSKSSSTSRANLEFINFEDWVLCRENKLDKLLGDSINDIAIILTNIIKGNVSKESTILEKLLEARESAENRKELDARIKSIKSALERQGDDFFESSDFTSIKNKRISNILRVVSKMELNND